MSDFLDDLPEVFVSNTEISASVHQAVQQGKLSKIGSRLYTKNLEDDPETIVKRNWHTLLKEYYADALIADRTAIENRPAEDGSVFIVSSKRRKTKLSGITLNPRQGYGPLDSDRSFIAGLKLSSLPRAYLENMRPSRARDGIARTLDQEEIETRLETYLRQRGEKGLNRIRDQAYVISKKIDMTKEFKQLDELIGSLLGTRDVEMISETAKARKQGLPFDPDRIERFTGLFHTLREIAPLYRPATKLSQAEKTNLSFFEAYFSNFIEGTEFEVEEAANIIFGNAIPAERPEDAHDILGTFRIVSNYNDMSRLPKNFDHFLKLLKHRHAIFMEQRPDKNPGQFKTKTNVAGSTSFVDPDLVIGTLKKGYEIYKGLDDPFCRAVYMMFLVSEVHPFTDGNGRAARMMMNAELVSHNEQKIIIPTVYLNNYITALKAITHNNFFDPLIRTLNFAQKYTQAIDWSDFEHAQKILAETNAFMDPTIADSEGIRLRLPVGA